VVVDAKKRSTPFPAARAIIETILIVAGLLAQLLLLPHGMYGDGKTRFLALSALLEHGQLSSMQYSLLGPLFSTPFWLLGKWFWTAEKLCEEYNLFLLAAALMITYILLRKRVASELLRIFFLIIIAASMFAMHVTTYYGEVFTAVCVGFGIMAITLSRLAVPGWLAIVLGVVNTPATLGGLVCLLLTRILEQKRLRYLLVLLAAGVLILAEAWLRRGSPFNSGYTHDAGYRTIMPYSGLPGFSYPFFFGLLSILFSFGKGLIFFAPGLLLPVRKALLERPEQEQTKLALYQTYVMWVAFLVGLILVYARWWAWYGGLFWGPRFFLIASIPASFALATRLQQTQSSLMMNLLTLLALSLSCWVGLDGAVYANTSVPISLCTVNHAQLELLCHYTPEFSVLWYPFVVHQHLDLQQKLYTAYWLCASAYLTVPLLARIARQAIELGSSLGRTHLDVTQWRF
jgi:hypothetical protein